MAESEASGVKDGGRLKKIARQTFPDPTNISWPDLGLQSRSGSGPDPSKRVGRVSMANY